MYRQLLPYIVVYLALYAAVVDCEGLADVHLDKEIQVAESSGTSRAHRVERYGFWRPWWRPWGWGWGCCWGWGWGKK
uniref:Uncharacterized protein n=1 Tax=Steinernema glaseri TaxID=37863 RepID=A0A1I7ZLG6_9BILA